MKRVDRSSYGSLQALQRLRRQAQEWSATPSGRYSILEAVLFPALRTLNEVKIADDRVTMQPIVQEIAELMGSQLCDEVKEILGFLAESH